VRIIGIGSPFGDDRFGWAAAEALQRSSILSAVESGRIAISVLDRPGAMLLAQWHEADTVIVLDAVRSGAPPGTCHRFDDAGNLPAAGFPSSSHGFGVVAALELARILGNLPSRLLLRGIEIDPSCSGLSMSQTVMRVMPAYVREIEATALVLAQFDPPGATSNLA
jgi:hydrogenase maturation protease